jgi:hypothetical protein
LVSNEKQMLKQETFSKLVNLKRLELFITIPIVSSGLFSQLSKLEELILNPCLGTIKDAMLVIDKDSFFGLTNLISLDLSRSRFIHFDPEIFIHTPKLMDLNLYKTQVEVDKEFFAHLKNLKSIKYANSQNIEIHDLF